MHHFQLIRCLGRGSGGEAGIMLRMFCACRVGSCFFKFICKWEEYSLHILGIIHDFAVSIEVDPFGACEMLQAMLAEDCDGQKCVLKFVRLEGGWCKLMPCERWDFWDVIFARINEKSNILSVFPIFLIFLIYIVYTFLIFCGYLQGTILWFSIGILDSQFIIFEVWSRSSVIKLFRKWRSCDSASRESFFPKQFTVGVLNATLDLAALVSVGVVGFLVSEVVLSPVVSGCLPSYAGWVLVGVAASTTNTFRNQNHRFQSKFAYCKLFGVYAGVIFDWVKEMWCFGRVKICKNQFIDFVVPTSMRGTWLAKTTNFRCFWGSSEKNWKQRLHFESFVPQFSSESSHFPGVPCHILMCCASRQRFYITSLWSYPLSSVMRVTCRRESLLILLTICWLIPLFININRQQLCE